MTDVGLKERIVYQIWVRKESRQLTKKGQVTLALNPTWNKLSLPSESATPNLLPCWENLSLVTLAKVPEGLGVATGCWWPHSHKCTDPSVPPVKSDKLIKLHPHFKNVWNLHRGNKGCEVIRRTPSILCLTT